MREVGDQNHSKDGKGFHPGRDVLDLPALLLRLGRENKAPVEQHLRLSFLLQQVHGQ